MTISLADPTVHTCSWYCHGTIHAIPGSICGSATDADVDDCCATVFDDCCATVFADCYVGRRRALEADLQEETP